MILDNRSGPSLGINDRGTVAARLDAMATGCIHRAVMVVVEPILLRGWLCGVGDTGWSGNPWWSACTGLGSETEVEIDSLRALGGT